MTQPNSNLPPADDLDWLAFCYLAGELNDTAAADFETRLATSQAAREALAGAVALSQSVADAGPVSTPATVLDKPAPRSRWVAAIAWMSVGAAVCLAAIWYGKTVGTRGPEGVGTGDVSEQGELAGAWADWFDDSPADDEATADEEAIQTSEGIDGDESEENAEPIAPDWMLVALGGPADEGMEPIGDDMREEEHPEEALDPASEVEGT